jgi:hypothetical protein
MPKYSIIMPLKINSLNSFKIFSEISLPLYNKFLDTEDLDYFYIICPKSDINAINNYTSLYPSLIFKFIEEENILHQSIHNINDGWLKQQIIKLAISLILDTKHYLIVDSDLYLNQVLRYNDLFHDNKVKYSSEPWHVNNDKHYSTNSNWWKNSSNILNFNVENLVNEKHLMGVTPQIFITEHVRNLIKHLENVYGLEWQRIIYELKFTEYTLYWIYLIINNLTDLYTTEGVKLWKHDLDRNILHYHSEDEMKNIVKKSIDDKDTYFSVIQSYLPVNIDVMKNIIIPKHYEAVFLIASMTYPNRYQAFTREERVSQILDTLNTIKTRIPNSYCILIEGTKLTTDEKDKYINNFNTLIDLSEDDSIYPFINNPINIGHGEMKLLERGIEYILNNNIFSNYVFKLTSRYKLTDKFNINNYSKNKYCFREHIDSSINKNVFTTGLYSIPVNELSRYKNILIEGQNILSRGCNMVERLYVEMIDEKKIYILKDLGVEGMLSYNKKYFNL